MPPTCFNVELTTAALYQNLPISDLRLRRKQMLADYLAETGPELDRRWEVSWKRHGTERRADRRIAIGRDGVSDSSEKPFAAAGISDRSRRLDRCAGVFLDVVVPARSCDRSGALCDRDDSPCVDHASAAVFRRDLQPRQGSFAKPVHPAGEQGGHGGHQGAFGAVFRSRGNTRSDAPPDLAARHLARR